VADRNLVYGLFLAIFGATLSIGSYLILDNLPLTAMGIGLVVVGTAWAMTPPTSPPKETVAYLVKSSCSNIEALLEAVGAAEKAVYVPVKSGVEVIAYVPLRRAGNLTIEEVAENAGKMLISRGGSLGIVVSPPRIEFGNPVLVDRHDVEGILEYVLVDSEVASSVRAVEVEDGMLVEVYNPRLDTGFPRFRAVIGSLPSCVAAQAVATGLSKPIQIADERHEGNRLIVRLRVLNWTDKTFT